jgi:hypothetical protein
MIEDLKRLSTDRLRAWLPIMQGHVQAGRLPERNQALLEAIEKELRRREAQ